MVGVPGFRAVNALATANLRLPPMSFRADCKGIRVSQPAEQVQHPLGDAPRPAAFLPTQRRYTHCCSPFCFAPGTFLALAKCLRFFGWARSGQGLLVRPPCPGPALCW